MAEVYLVIINRGYSATKGPALFAGFILVTCLLITGACGDETQNESGQTPAPVPTSVINEVRGLVVAVESGSLTKLDSLIIEDEAGARWTFKAEVFVGMTPSHLLQHQFLAQPVTVRYVETPEGLIISEVAD